MTAGGIFGWLSLVLGIFGAQPGPVGTAVSRMIVEDEIILRVQIRPRPVYPEIRWVEHKSLKCIPVDGIRGALLSGPAQVDFVMADRSRVRAHIDEECPGARFLRQLLPAAAGRSPVRTARCHPLANGRKLQHRAIPASGTEAPPLALP